MRREGVFSLILPSLKIVYALQFLKLPAYTLAGFDLTTHCSSLDTTRPLHQGMRCKIVHNLIPLNVAAHDRVRVHFAVL
jgi:hypothetical protein